MLSSAVASAYGSSMRTTNHERVQGTDAFAVMTTLTATERSRGVVAATRGNHGMALAYAGAELKIPVTICVPIGNNIDKNEAIRGYGATLVEEGRDYDEAVTVAERLTRDQGLRMVHSTNDRDVIAGAGTLTLEMIEQRPSWARLSTRWGRLAGGRWNRRRTRPPPRDVPLCRASPGGLGHPRLLARRSPHREDRGAHLRGRSRHARGVYPLTFEALRSGLDGFVAVSDEAIAKACRALLPTTHNLVEGAGAAALAGLLEIAATGSLDNREVGIVLSGFECRPSHPRTAGCRSVIVAPILGFRHHRRWDARLHASPRISLTDVEPAIRRGEIPPGSAENHVSPPKLVPM